MDTNWALIVLLIVLGVLAVAVNVLLLVILKQVWGNANVIGLQLICGVGVGDLIAALVSVALYTSRIVLGDPGAFESAWFCRTFGFGLYYSYNLSGILLSFLALERYAFLCHKRRFNPYLTWIVFFCLWVLFAIPLLVTSIFGSYMPDITRSYCLPKESKLSAVAAYLVNFFTNLPLLVLGFCYVSIFLKQYRLNRENSVYFERRVSIRALLVFIIYMICYLPKLIATFYLIILKNRNKVPQPISVMIPIGLGMVMCINPILVIYLHRDFKQRVVLLVSPK